MNHPKILRHPALRVGFLAALAPFILWACGGEAPQPGGEAPQPGGEVLPAAKEVHPALPTQDPHETEAQALAAALESALEGDRIDVTVAVDLGPFEPAPLPDTMTTLEVGDDGVPSTTLDGRPISERELAEHAEAERRTINASLQAQFAERERRVAEIVAELGVKDEVTALDHGGFTLHASKERLGALLPEIGRRGHRATLPPRILTHSTSMNGALTAINVQGYALGYGMDGTGVGIWHDEPYPPNFQHPMLDTASWVRLVGTNRQPTGDGQVCVNNAECCSGLCSGGVCIPAFPNNCSCTEDTSSSCTFGTNACTSGPECVNGSCDCSVNGRCLNCNASCGGGYLHNQSACTGAPRYDEHSTATGLSVQQAAPGATYYDGIGGSCLILSSIVNQTNPPAYVGTSSVTYAPTGLYSSCDATWDSFIQSSRIAMFNSSSNTSGYVPSPATAFNVTGVGMSDPAGSLPVFGWGNPNTGANKPEISAPGINIIWGNPAVDNPSPGGWDPASGCSISAPFAAGFAADMMSGSSYYKNNPQAVKANMVASANGSAPGTRSFAPQIDYLGAYFYRSGSTWNGGNTSYFDSNGNITTTTTMTAGNHYRIAISWLAYAPNVSSPVINQSIKLQVSQGSTVYTQYDPYSNYQVLDLHPTTSGTWTITIHRVTNAGGNVNLALSVGQIVDF